MSRLTIFCLQVIFSSILFNLSISSSCFSQSALHKLFGTEGNDFGGLVATKDNFFIVGHTTLHGSDDIYISKLDKNLNEIWSNIYKGSAGERAMELVQKADDNLLVSGWEKSGNSSTLLEISNNGSILKVTGFGSFHDRLHKVLRTNDGGYLNYGELEGAVPGHNKVALVKYNESLSIEWKKYYSYASSSDNSSAFEMYARQAYQLIDDNIIILGSYTEIHNAHHNRKIRLIKTDSFGNELWTRGFHGGRMDNAYHFIVTKDNGFLISATSNSYSNSQTDILLIKTNHEGKTEWLKTYGGNSNELAGQILQIENGNYIISGSTESFGSGSMDFLLFEIDSAGNLKKAHVYGGNHDDIATRLITKNGDYYVSGYSNSFGYDKNNIYVVKTQLDEVRTDCAIDITNNIQQKNVSTTFFDSHYSTGNFVNPNPINLTQQSVNSFAHVPCINCPDGEKKELILCPSETVQIDYSDKNSSGVIWQDDVTDLTRKIEYPGLFWVDYTLNNCTIRDSIDIKLETEDTLDLGSNGVICPEDTIILNANMEKANAFKWSDGTSDSTLAIISPGNYHVQVFTEYCEFLDTIVFQKYAHPSLDLGEDKILCLGETISLSPEIEGALNYKWSSGQTASSISVSIPGQYSVEISTFCSILKDSIHFIAPQKVDLFIPNVITPNDDSFNDVFIIPNTDFPVELSVVNRYGKEVYKSPSYSNNWGGNNLSSGVYYYFLKIGCTQQENKGWLKIIK